MFSHKTSITLCIKLSLNEVSFVAVEGVHLKELEMNSVHIMPPRAHARKSNNSKEEKQCSKAIIY